MQKQSFNGLTQQLWDFSDLVLKNRLAQALEQGAARYPIFRELRFAARVELEVLLDAIALDPAWRAERSTPTTLILDRRRGADACRGDGVQVLRGGRQSTLPRGDLPRAALGGFHFPPAKQ